MNATMTEAPKRLPLIGNLAALASGRLSYLEELTPLADIVELRVGPQRFYQVNNPDLLHKIMTVDSDKYDKGKFFENVSMFLGNGLLTCSKGEHRKQRRMIQPAFHHAELRRYSEFMAACAVKQVDSYQDGQVLDVYVELQKLTMLLMTKTIFSADDYDSVTEDLGRVLPVFLKGILSKTMMPDFLNKVPTPGNRRFDRARDTMRGSVRSAIQRYRAEESDLGDLMSLLLAARDTDGSSLDDEMLVDQVVTFMMAGSETTASTMCWFLHAMTSMPELGQRIRAEIAEVVGDRTPTVDDMPKLGTLQHSLFETLRLYNPVWFQTRRSLTAVSLGGNEFEAGTNFIYSPAAIHRDPRMFTDPLEFKPERWIDPSHPRTAYIPFGSGARKCIGDSFSMISMHLALVALVQRWSFSPVDADKVMPFAGAVLHPQHLRLRLTSRKAAALAQS